MIAKAPKNNIAQLPYWEWFDDGRYNFYSLQVAVQIVKDRIVSNYSEFEELFKR